MRRIAWLGIAGVGAVVSISVALWEGRRVQTPAAPNKVQTGAKVRRRVPPPMFSREYVEALRDILELEPQDAVGLEQRVAKNPEDLTARLRLLAYYRRADQAGSAENRAARYRQVTWLLEHHPESEILASPQAGFSAGELTAAQAQRLGELWRAASAAQARDARVQWNAAQYFRPVEPGVWLDYLQRAVELDPKNERYGLELGIVYGGVLLAGREGRPREVGLTADEVRRRLEATENAAMLEAAVRSLQSAYNSSLMMGREDAELGRQARYYFERAKALNPEVDEAWVMPVLDPKLKGMLVRGAPHYREMQKATEAALKVRRLGPDAFPQLPPVVRGVLRARECLVPQPRAEGPGVNVVRGEFFAAGKAGWAVVCSSSGRSRILAFRDDLDSQPEELAPSDDLMYLADGQYSREIRAVGREFIVRHYRAYGGPAPPPIAHQGIDDAFLGKASMTYYRHEGKWLQLQGAD